MGEGAITATATDAAAVRQFEAAHAELRADSSIQFNLPPVPPEPETPGWLKALIEWLGDVLEPIGRFLSWLGSFVPDAPYARAALWVVLALTAAAVLWLVYQRIRTGEWRLPRRRPSARVGAGDEEQWTPDAAPVHAWLEEADALAAEGRFADAIHHLLFRSVEDIARRRPQLVRPAVTSREIASADAIPSKARDLFAAIARLVERSLFGGRPVGAGDWAQARSAYADFALPQAWRA